MMNRLFKLVLGLTVIAAAWTALPGDASAACRRGNCWGAVAFGPNGAWAYAVNYSTRGQAGSMALRKCQGRCTRYLTFRNSCGAYASGRGAYGWGNAHTRRQAESRALLECRRRTSGCRVRVWGCTTR
jgi:serine/threonine-protein kinase